MSVYGDDWNLEPVALVSLPILLYIDFFQDVLVRDSGCHYLLFGLVAEVTAGLCVKDYAWFCAHGLSIEQKRHGLKKR